MGDGELVLRDLALLDMHEGFMLSPCAFFPLHVRMLHIEKRSTVAHTHVHTSFVCPPPPIHTHLPTPAQTIVSLVLAYMLVWDMPKIKDGVATLKSSRLAPVYNEVAPSLGVFGKLFGKALEAQVCVCACAHVCVCA